MGSGGVPARLAEGMSQCDAPWQIPPMWALRPGSCGGGELVRRRILDVGPMAAEQATVTPVATR